MGIRSESELLRRQAKKLLYALITLPYHLLDILIHPSRLAEKVNALRDWLVEFWRWFFESKATALLIMINIVTFAVSMIMFSEQDWERFILYPESVLRGNILMLISSAFLHASIWHLGGNMLVLLIMGRIVERELGSWWMLVVYFGSMIISGIGASAFYALVAHTNIGSLGASGAVSGVTSAAILLSPFYLTYLVAGIPLPVSVVGWAFVIQDVLAVLNPVRGDNVGHIAHLGGYAATFLILFFASGAKKKFFTGLVVNAVIVIFALAAYQFRIISLGNAFP